MGDASTVDVYLPIITALLSLMIALGAVVGRMIIARLNDLRDVDDSQWARLTDHERRISTMEGGQQSRQRGPAQ